MIAFSFYFFFKQKAELVRKKTIRSVVRERD